MGGDKLNIQNKRVIKILKILLNTKASITGEEISNLIGVSSRTVRSDMKNINSLLKEYGADINSEKGKGYKLEINDRRIFSKFKSEICDNDISASLALSNPEDRVNYIMTKLLINDLQNKPITQMDLADKLFISVSTLKNDLKEVEKKLDKYELKIISYKE